LIGCLNRVIRAGDYRVLRFNANELVVAVDPRRSALIVVVDMAFWAHVWERAQLVAGGW